MKKKFRHVIVPKKRAEPAKEAKLTHIWLIGRHAVEAALTHGQRDILEVCAVDSMLPYVRSWTEHEGMITKVSREELDRRFPERPHQGVAARVGALKEVRLEDVIDKTDLILLLDQVTDPHNLGACLRSADAFGCGAVVVPSRNSATHSDVAAKAASGAMETVPLIDGGNLNQAIEKLKEAGFWIVGLAGEGEQILHETNLKGKTAFVMGSEGSGLRDLVRRNCDVLVRIPMFGTVESLNVSVSAALSLYEFQRQKNT